MVTLVVDFNITGVAANISAVVSQSDGTLREAVSSFSEAAVGKKYLGTSTLIQSGDGVQYFYNTDLIASETYRLEVTAADIADAVWDEDITTHNIVDSAGELIQSLVQVFAGLPLPSISIDTIKTILQFTDTEYDDQLTLLIPIIEDVVVQYCGVSTISDLSVGAIFPIAGLVRYAMENPIGAKLQQVGSDRTEYGEFPNALLKLLDNFKPDTEGGYANAEVINLNDINEDLGI